MAAAAAAAHTAMAQKQPLDLSDYQPRSRLQTKVTPVDRARFPALDFHTHLAWSVKAEAGIQLRAERQFLAEPGELLAVMDRRDVETLINLTGGYGDGLRASVARFDKAHPGRFISFTEPSYEFFTRPDYPRMQAEAIRQAHADGARGLKILKTLGLYLRDRITTGALIEVDDPRFDPMWDACGQLGMPVAIHVSDPLAFFDPIDRYNERWEELNNHPDWSFHGPGFPTNAHLLEARDRVFARHPKTNFVALHVGNFAEDLDSVSQALDRHPNMYVDIAARIGELGRQPRRSRVFFERYQDRIVFGTDAVPHGDEFPQQLFGDKLYEIYFRFLETADEYFDYAPAKVPPQGRWEIYGLDLPPAILQKVYRDNARKLLAL